MAVPAIADFQTFACVGVVKFEEPLAPFIGPGRRVKDFGHGQSSGHQGAELEKASAGDSRAVIRLGNRRLRSLCFSHAVILSQGFGKSMGVHRNQLGGRSFPFLPGSR